jgi:hypothetical protein
LFSIDHFISDWEIPSKKVDRTEVDVYDNLFGTNIINKNTGKNIHIMKGNLPGIEKNEHITKGICPGTQKTEYTFMPYHHDIL